MRRSVKCQSNGWLPCVLRRRPVLDTSAIDGTFNFGRRQVGLRLGVVPPLAVFGRLIQQALHGQTRRVNLGTNPNFCCSIVVYIKNNRHYIWRCSVHMNGAFAKLCVEVSHHVRSSSTILRIDKHRRHIPHRNLHYPSNRIQEVHMLLLGHNFFQMNGCARNLVGHALHGGKAGPERLAINCAQFNLAEPARSPHFCKLGG